MFLENKNKISFFYGYLDNLVLGREQYEKY